jgi:uncharacterized membrane protein YciS (DUF1049 family)
METLKTILMVVFACGLIGGAIFFAGLYAEHKEWNKEHKKELEDWDD